MAGMRDSVVAHALSLREAVVVPIERAIQEMNGLTVAPLFKG